MTRTPEEESLASKLNPPCFQCSNLLCDLLANIANVPPINKNNQQISNGDISDKVARFSNL
jgi:hypothetical protein